MALGVALIAGILKEWIDRKTTGFDKMDLLATLGGGTIAVVVWIGITLIDRM